jgi:hypothetical protein
MEYNKINVGKIRSFNEETGVGEIVTSSNTYMFTLNDLKTPNIEEGDLVKFRGELINDTNKAFFVTKITPEHDLSPVGLKGKVFHRKGND